MAPPTIRVLAASGVYLRRQLQSLCNQLERQPGKTGAKHQIIDDYLLRAIKVNGRVTGLLIDLPAYLWFVGVFHPEFNHARRGGLIAALPTRDVFSATVRHLPDPESVNMTATPAIQESLLAPAEGLGTYYHTLYAKLFESRCALTSMIVHAPANTNWLTSSNRQTVAASVRCYLPSVVNTVALREDTFWDVSAEGRGLAMRDNSLRSIDIYLHESYVLNDIGHLIYPKGSASATNQEWNLSLDVRPWITHLPWSVGDNELSFVVAFSTFVQASSHDPRGRACQAIVRFDVEFGEVGDTTVAYEYLHVVDPTTSPNPAERPVVWPAGQLAGAYHSLNYQAPTYMARVGDTLVCVVRGAVNTSASPPDTLHWHYNAKVLQIDISTGVTTETPLITPDILDDSDGLDINWWHWAAVGMDSDGETAVYIAMHNWSHSATANFPEPAGWEVGLGIVTVGPSGVNAFRVEDPGCYALLSRFNGSYGLNNPETPNMDRFWSDLTMLADGVTYIGNGKFVFPVSLNSPPPIHPDIRASIWHADVADPDPRRPYPMDTVFDFSVAQYRLGDSGITVLSTVADGLIYNNAFDKPAPITVVQYERANESGDVVQPAVLLASVGNGTAQSGIQKGEGKTFISYDSGLTWELLADSGSARGVHYVGTLTSGFTNKRDNK